MTPNQILLLVIVILVSIILVVGIYFLSLHLINKKRKKKIDNVFNPNNLVEEESLMNVLDDKKNMEFQKSNKDEERFVMNQEEVKVITNEALTQEEKVNPFGVDLTMRNKDNTPIEYTPPSSSTNSSNKFFK